VAKGFLEDFKNYKEAEIMDPTIPAGPLAELAARPLPQLAADLFAACFGPGTDGWEKGASQTDATRDFFKSEGLGSVPDNPHLAEALVAEAFQLLGHRGLLCLYLADGSRTVHVHWYVTRAGRAAAEAGNLLETLG
jgi:hypothetical protein